MTSPKKVINKIRRKGGEEKVLTRVQEIIIQNRAKKRRREAWEKDKAIVRGRNFKKAQAALEEKRKQKKAEEDRQNQIIEARLKNLKKARRVLKRKRNNGQI